MPDPSGADGAGRPGAPVRVRVVGTGLIGASLGIALTRAGHDVVLDDPSPTAAGLARDLGAGRPATPHDPAPDLVVVAAPPDVAGRVVAAELDRWPHAVVTDVASVKEAVAAAVAAAGADLSRYVGSHPMAGRERSGAMAARADLFEGRAWVVVPGESSDPAAIALVRRVAEAVGSVVTVMGAHEHDAAVAVVSHVPQVAASLVAARLREVSDDAVALAGQGLRDVTRIAASDARLWTQILAGNAAAVRAVLTDLRDDLDGLLDALDALTTTRAEDGPAAPGALEVVARRITDGNTGQARIPGKHGGGPTSYASVVVVVPTARARWRRCSPTSARRASTSRTCASTTVSACPSASPRWRSCRPPWSTCAPPWPSAAGVSTTDGERDPAATGSLGCGPVTEPPAAPHPDLALDGHRLVVAIDGPSGSGKSSVARAVARDLGVGFLDTGAMYRALTWWCLDRGIELTDRRAVADAALVLPLRLATDPDAVTVAVDGTDVTAAIREPRISQAVSAVATNLDVREILVRRQRALVAETAERTGGCVAEGRDITTVVAPDAPVRVLLTASVEARLARRATELHGTADASALAAPTTRSSAATATTPPSRSSSRPPTA